MRKKRHSPEQIIRKLRQTDKRLAFGTSVLEVAREISISEATYCRWRDRYGEMDPSEAKRLKELDKENARRKKLVADQVRHLDLADRHEPTSIEEHLTKELESVASLSIWLAR